MTIDVFITLVLAAPFVFFALYLGRGWLGGRQRRRTIYVPNSPGTEIEQRYGGYAANAYDADSGSTRSRHHGTGGDWGESNIFGGSS